MSYIELGDMVRDQITGLQGIVVCMSHWIYGCIRVAVQPVELKDGKPVEATHFDVAQLAIITKDAMSLSETEVPTEIGPTGGPARNEERR